MDISAFADSIKIGSRVRILDTQEEGYVLSTSFSWAEGGVPSVSYVVVGPDVADEDTDEYEDEEAPEYLASELEVLEDASLVTVTELAEYLASLAGDDDYNEDDEEDEEEEDPADAENEEEDEEDEDTSDDGDESPEPGSQDEGIDIGGNDR